MAARKPRRVSASSVAQTATVTADANDPNSWLYLNPTVSTIGVTFGVLRKTYGGRTNTAVSFGWRKCHVGRAATDLDQAIWSPNVERVEVILPAAADDSLCDPAVLLASMDAAAIDREKALLTSVTLPLGDVSRVHAGWERARSFARRIAAERQLASVLILHAPGVIGQPFPLHAHCLIVPRRIGGLGLRHGCYDEDLIHDRGQAIAEELWVKCLEEAR